MAGTLQFDLVSPERKLISAQVAEVRLPATEGDMSAMPGHAPTITTLRPGVLKVISAAGTQAFVVTGGFAEINGTSTAVLAERAVPVSELTAASVDALIAETLAGLSGSEIERASAASDLQAMKVAAGF